MKSYFIVKFVSFCTEAKLRKSKIKAKDNTKESVNSGRKFIKIKLILTKLLRNKLRNPNSLLFLSFLMMNQYCFV